MTKIDNETQLDRISVTDDEKKRAIDWYTSDIQIPSVGIFDEPTRCYIINKEWASIVMGLVSWLTEIAAWRNAQDETYPPIIEVSKFLVGDNCMTLDCEQLNDCLEVSDVINNIINELNDLRDYVQNGDVAIDLGTTIVPDIYPYNEQQETLADLEYVGCNPDEVWGAVSSIVDYIDKTNKDFLQRVSSATNLAAQIERAIAATPVIGWFPADEVVGLVDWYANEASNEYLATVDEALLQQTKCDLFCLAMSNVPCGLNFADLIDYFSSKVPISAGQFVDTLSNLILFALTGTFIGNDYFYYMSYFQLAVAGVGEKFFNTRGVATYEIYAAAGKNSPDSDWSLFCDDCPQYMYIEYDFTLSPHGFTSVNGSWVAGQGWVANITEPSAGNYRADMTIRKTYPVDGQIFGGGMIYSAISNCGIEANHWLYYVDGVEEGGRAIGGISNGDNIKITYTNSTVYAPETFDEISFRVNPADCDGIAPHGKGIISKARIWMPISSAITGIPSNDAPIGLPVNGSSSEDYWQP